MVSRAVYGSVIIRVKYKYGFINVIYIIMESKKFIFSQEVKWFQKIVHDADFLKAREESEKVKKEVLAQRLGIKNLRAIK